jgi:tRNA dimethylallyltransferase
MDIGTGKDYKDYLVDGKRIPAHLIDIVDAGFEYNVYLFKQDFLRIFNEIIDRGKLPVLCGGTGMYIESVLRNYKLVQVPVDQNLRDELSEKSIPELEEILRLYGPLHNVSDTSHRKRLIRAIEIARYQGSLPELGDVPSIRPLVIGIRYERLLRRQRITERLKTRLEKEGLVEEVKRLLDAGITAEKLDYYGLEYRYISQYLKQKISYEEMFSQLNSAIHQFAKRQMTYFRGMERRGIAIHWLDGQLSTEEKLEKVLILYNDYDKG